MEFSDLLGRARAVLGFRRLSESGQAGTVAAALLTAGGAVHVGVCIDLPCALGCCAEHAAIAAMITAGESRIEKIVAVGEHGIMPPCGRCREFISQVHDANRDTLVMVAEGRVVRLRELLPHDWRDVKR
ncbi:hypothetical protein LJC23_02680 [Desulfovibrio sp. OttesenSCG-928-I05]|nr:hypothetical protein [Desulfovibrio sp. OttesenSCG-928-I05]